MFHPASNRLAAFLEVSALSIQLSHTGSAQFKAGYLRIDSVNSKGGGFGRSGAGRRDRKASKWCAVRESYIVVVEEIGTVSSPLHNIFYCADTDSTFRPTSGTSFCLIRTSKLSVLKGITAKA